jgi:NADPH2:quinone reductase
MRAAVLHRLGERPRYETFPAPHPGAGEAVVTVSAAALKPSDRLMARGVGYAPAQLPHVVGLDGVGRLGDGSRVAFMIPETPYGAMAERTLVRRGAWLPVPDEIDDVTAAAFANPGMAAWKTIVWEGQVAADRRVLILGATGASGRIAAQLAIMLGARVVVAGRNQSVLAGLVRRGAAATVALDRPREEIAADLRAEGPYDVIADYLWGAPAEAAFSALASGSWRQHDGAIGRARYILVGMAAGEDASLPAMALRRAPVELLGSGTLPAPTLDRVAAAYAELLGQVATGTISIEIETRPLADVAEAWAQPDGGRRVVLVP